MLWLLSAVIGNQAASQHIADARVPEHACGSNTLGGWGDMTQSRPAWHTVSILRRLRRQGHAGGMPGERPARPVGGPGPGPGRPGPGPGGARRDAKNAAGAEPPSSCIARGGCVAPAGRCGLVADPLDEQRQFRMAKRTSRCNRGWRMGGRDARVARGRARLAAVATRWMRHTQVARPAHIPPQVLEGGRGSQRASGTGTCAARCGRDALDAAQTIDAPGAHPAAGRGRRARGRDARFAR